MPARPPKPVRQQIAESQAMLTARDQASQTPEAVRTAFLARRRKVGGIFIEPFNLGILWLFEELKHPFHTPTPVVDEFGKPVPVLGEDGEPLMLNGNKVFKTEPVTYRDIAYAVFIFNDSEAADEALAAGEDNFRREAFALARGIPTPEINEIAAIIKKTFEEGRATVPGGGAANPPQTGS